MKNHPRKRSSWSVTIKGSSLIITHPEESKCIDTELYGGVSFQYTSDNYFGVFFSRGLMSVYISINATGTVIDCGFPDIAQAAYDRISAAIEKIQK